LSGLRYPEDIAIKITGLRPGEKLYEELLMDSERNLATYNEKIKIAQQSTIDCEVFRRGIHKLATLKNSDNSAVVGALKEIVPEYISNNSVFEDLDKKQPVLEEVK